MNLKDIRNPTKEVYVMLELHGGRIDDPDFDKCAYYDEELANQTQKLIQSSMNNSILIDEVIPKENLFLQLGLLEIIVVIIKYPNLEKEIKRIKKQFTH